MHAIQHILTALPGFAARRAFFTAACAALLVATAYAGPPTHGHSGGDGRVTPAFASRALLYNALGDDLPGTAGPQIRVAHSAQGFARRTARLADRPDFAGSIEICRAEPNLPEWEAPDGGMLHARITVHDLSAVQGWAAAGLTPGYLLGEETEVLPPLSETAIVIELLQREVDGSTLYLRLRIRSADGVCAVAEARRGDEVLPVPDAPLRAGPWWPVCCGSQWLLCELSRLISPAACTNCYENCMLRCLMGGANPCHSCGACGLSDFLCRFVPGANC